jgi:FK506-binding nuclear protein
LFQVGIYHVARFPRGRKILYETVKGLPFTFRLGNGEVIKGWDMGIVGMRVGGKRRITVPPHLAFGKKVVIPQVPPNSTLVYDVELKSVTS